MLLLRWTHKVVVWVLVVVHSLIHHVHGMMLNRRLMHLRWGWLLPSRLKSIESKLTIIKRSRRFKHLLQHWRLMGRKYGLRQMHLLWRWAML